MLMQRDQRENHKFHKKSYRRSVAVFIVSFVLRDQFFYGCSRTISDISFLNQKRISPFAAEMFNDLSCNIIHSKHRDSYQIFKSKIKCTSLAVRNKFNAQYKSPVKDDEFDRLILRFGTVEKNVSFLMPALLIYEKRTMEYASCSKTIVILFKRVFDKQPWEKPCDCKSFKEIKNADKANPNFTAAVKENVESIENDNTNSSSSVESSTQLLNKDKSCLKKNLHYHKNEFTLDALLKSGFTNIEEKLKPVFDFYHTQLIGSLENLFKCVLLPISESLKLRELLLLEYNRCKAKFEKIETKELKGDLNILQEKTYKKLMIKLEITALEYKKTHCIIKKDMLFFLNHLFPKFLDLWFKQFYFTLYSISLSLRQIIARPVEIKEFKNQSSSVSKNPTQEGS